MDALSADWVFPWTKKGYMISMLNAPQWEWVSHVMQIISTVCQHQINYIKKTLWKIPNSDF